MKSLLAVDLALGPDLEYSIRRVAEHGEAFCVLDQRLSVRRRREQIEMLGATELLDANGRTPLDSGRLVDDEIGLVMLTSGSSGPPKAAELTWAALRAGAELTQSTWRHDGALTWFPVLPANHIGGLAVILRAVLSDATLLWGDVDDLASAPARGATHVSVVRTQLVRHDLTGFTTVLLGGAKPPMTLPENVVTTWGMTETGSGVVYDGRPLAGVEVASVGGEILVRSPTLFRSYRSSPRPGATGPDGLDDWFPTGDAGDVIDGRVSIRGRISFVINTGGEKLWPEELETILASVDGVRDVAVTGVLDDEWGERVVALVVSDGTVLDDALRAIATERIGPWSKPKEIRYVAAIPRTSNGKIRRDALSNLY